MESTSTSFKGKCPYNKVLKARVVAAEASPRQYKGNDGADKSSLTSAISDEGCLLQFNKICKVQGTNYEGKLLKKGGQHRIQI